MFDKLVYETVPAEEGEERHSTTPSAASGSHTSIKALLPPLGLGSEDITLPCDQACRGACADSDP